MGLLPSMMIAASKGAPEIITSSVGRHGQERDSAVLTVHLATAQVLTISHGVLQCDQITMDSRLGAVVLMPIWQKLKEVPDRDRPKAKFSGRVKKFFCTPSSTFWTLTRPASARFFYLLTETQPAPSSAIFITVPDRKATWKRKHYLLPIPFPGRGSR
jgi:hypothetical protein